MRKILLLLILIYTSCNDPTSSTPDLSEAIIGNWWLYHQVVKAGDFVYQDNYYNLNNTHSILAIDSDSLTSYFRDDPENSDWELISASKYRLNEGTLIVTDTSSGIDYYSEISMRFFGILRFRDLTYIPTVINEFKKYIGLISPER